MKRQATYAAAAPAAPVHFVVLTLPNGVSTATATAADFGKHEVTAGDQLEARDIVASSVAVGRYIAEINPQGVESAALIRARARATEEGPPADLRAGGEGNVPKYISTLGGQS